MHLATVVAVAGDDAETEADPKSYADAGPGPWLTVSSCHHDLPLAPTRLGLITLCGIFLQLNA